MVTYTLPLAGMTRTLSEYLDGAGASPFDRWFNTLSAAAAEKVATALYRLEQGNTPT